jgi:hypothetical protein
MHIIIRDDDTSFFTTPQMLETVYSEVWKLGIPVCLSAIPAHSTVELQQPYLRKHLNSLYDLNVPPFFRGTNKTFYINENKELCSFLNERIKEGLVDIAVHGSSHTTEFQSMERDDVNQILAQGTRVLRSCFPAASLNTFVPPYEFFSPVVRDILLESGYNISTNYENFYIKTWLDNLRHWKYRIRKRFLSEIPQKTVELKGMSKIFFGINNFSPDTPASQCLDNAIQTFEECRQTHKIFICINHYWYFFKDWGEPRADLLAAWNKFIQYTQSFPEVNWTTFDKFSMENS